MASFNVSGIDGLQNLFKNMERMPYSVIEEMLDKQADVVVNAQRQSAESMLDGPHNKGEVKKAIKKGKTKRKKDGLVKYVTFNGKQHGSRLAEIAFINEYGKNGQKARPFIKVANEKCEKEAQDVAGKVFDDWIETL